MSPPAVDSLPALVIGCGYLGRRVAVGWRAAGRRVLALTRSRSNELAAMGLEPLVGDVTDLARLPVLPSASSVLYAVGPDRGSGMSLRDVCVSGLANVLSVIRPPGTFIFVSSTGVYGQTDASEVDESSATEPMDESGRILLEAERLLRDHLPGAIVLRLAGIYGPDRVPRRQAVLRGEPLVGDPDKWLNLIHVTDGARAVLAAEGRGRPGETYNIADGCPVSQRDFYTLMALLLGAPPVPFESPTVRDPVEANRRVSTAKARSELGFVPAFPSYREGLPTVVAGERKG